MLYSCGFDLCIHIENNLSFGILTDANLTCLYTMSVGIDPSLQVATRSHYSNLTSYKIHVTYIWRLTSPLSFYDINRSRLADRVIIKLKKIHHYYT